MDRHAAAADGILVINRVKAHTDFAGRFESGLAKMMTIGMGKHAQAMAVHQHGAGGLREHMPRIAAAMLRTGRVLEALAIVENARRARRSWRPSCPNSGVGATSTSIPDRSP